MPIQISGMTPLIQVYDLQESLHFYCDILGFVVISSDNKGAPQDWCLLRWGEARLMLNTQFEAQHRPPHRDMARKNYHQDTALFFSCDNLDETYELLKTAEIQVKAPIVREYGIKQIYVYDPDGYELCFQAEV